MDLWLSTSNLDTWAHGQSFIHGAPEFVLSTLNLNHSSGSIEPFVILGDGEVRMDRELARRICQESTSVLTSLLQRRLRSVSAAAQAGMPGRPAA